MYQIYQHNDGRLLLVIEPQMSDPEEPMFIYDGGDTALLFRNWGSTIKLKALSDAARTPLKEAHEILIRECLLNEIVREYTIPVRIVRDVKSMMA